MNHLMLYTDGSVDPDSGTGFGAYLAVEDPGQSVESLEPLVKIVSFDQTSSTRLEPQVLLHALGEVRSFVGRVTVHTDSQNVVGLVGRRSRLEGAGYRSRSGRLLNNHDLYREFYLLIDEQDCEFVKVRGHRASGQRSRTDKLFTLVDRASRKAMRRSRTRRPRCW